MVELTKILPYAILLTNFCCAESVILDIDSLSEESDLIVLPSLKSTSANNYIFS